MLTSITVIEAGITIGTIATNISLPTAARAAAAVAYPIERVVLDFRPMSCWRKLLIVVLLALSLPVQSFAAISMKCVAAHTHIAGAPARHAEHDMPKRHHVMRPLVVTDDGHHHDYDHDGTQLAHSCSTCASCCVGVALPAVPSVADSLTGTRITIRMAPSAGVASFVTDGIERPPRYSLV